MTKFTIPKEILDMGINYHILNNQYIGNARKGHLRIDYLTLVSDLGDKNQKLSDRLSLLKSDDRYKVHISDVNLNTDTKNRYWKRITITSKENEGIKVIIEYRPYNSNSGFIRVDLRPQHAKPCDMNKIIYWLASKRRLGEKMFTILKNAWLTRIDFALDLFGVSYTDYYFYLKSASVGQFHKSDGNNTLGGINLGSCTSSIYFAIYDKFDNNEIACIKDPIVDMGSINLNILRDKKINFMRIEARLKPRKKEIMLSSIENIVNPFSKLFIYDKEVKYKLSQYKEFADMLDEMTIPQAINAIVNSDDKSKIKRILNQYQYPLFDKSELWKENKIQCLSLLGILYQPAYWEKDIRNKRKKPKSKSN